MNKLVTSLRCFHNGPGGGASFSVFETIRRYWALAEKCGVSLPDEIGPALQTLAKIESAVGPPRTVAPCHNDLLSANFVEDESKVWILDWEYAGVGDVFFDLANLAANNGFELADEEMLLRIYFGKMLPADMARLRLLRLASDLREALWGFLQVGISRLDFDFRAYALQHLHRFLIAATRECIRS
jgi:thiamine kinase-like enzyme